MKYFLVALFPVIALVAVMYFVIDSIYQNEARDEANQRALSIANEAEVEFNYLIRPLVASNIYLARSNSLKKLLETQEERQAVLADFSLLAKTHPVFQQVRLLDTSGIEVLRVNYDNKGVEQIPRDELQDKSSRDYMAVAKELELDQIYVTPIGLNIEYGKVEVPYRAVMRIISPVYGKGSTYIGYLVFNVSVERLLSLLDVQMKIKHEKLLLLNGNGEGVEYRNGEISYHFKNSNLGSFSDNDTVLNRILQFKSEATLNQDIGSYGWKEFDLEKSNFSIAGVSFLEPKEATFKVIAFTSVERNEILMYMDPVDKLLVIGLCLSFLVLAFMLAIGRSQLEKRHVLISELNDELIKSQALLNEEKHSLKKVIHELSYRNKQLKEFSSIISHNVKAPLSSLSLLVSYLKNHQEEIDGDTRREALDKLKYSSETLNLIAEDLWDTVKVLDREEVTVGKVNLHLAILNVTKSFTEEIEQGQIEIQTNLENWGILVFNNEYLESVLTTLIGNSIKYRKEGRRLIVNLRTETEKGKKVLKISDNGKGINLDWHGNNIFGMHRTFHRDIAGRGMGLFMVKMKLEVLGANIFVESQEGEGTTFSIMF